MQIKSILAGTAIALAATIGSASAAGQYTALDRIPGDEFYTLAGIPFEAMNAEEMEQVSGSHLIITNFNGASIFKTTPSFGAFGGHACVHLAGSGGGTHFLTTHTSGHHGVC